MSTTDPGGLLTPDHLTLLLKHGKSTTVLSVLPSQKLTEVKAMLLTALQSRNQDTFSNSALPLPTDPKDFELGILADRRDLSKGWISVEDGISLLASKSSKKKPASKSSGQISIVGDLDIRDGSWIAYRLKTTEDQMLDDSTDDDIKMREDQGWNVIIPTYEEEEEDNMPNEPFTMPAR